MFLQVIDDFSFLQINDDRTEISENAEGNDTSDFKAQIANHDIIQLSNNFIPKGLIPLEKLFDQNDVFRNLQSISSEDDIEEINVGTDKDIKNIKLCTSLDPKIKTQYFKLLQNYKDVFAWTYADLKTYDTSLIQHKIPLKPKAKPYQQKLTRINPALLPTVEREIKKMLDAQIILPLRYSNWVANLVPVRKKNGEIRLCMDFRNLNKASLKDNYPLPKMEQLLQMVSGAQRLSMLDGFSGYNQGKTLIQQTEKR